MHGLPNQSIEDALFDLKTALSFSPPHLSWYQLTLEPILYFIKSPTPSTRGIIEALIKRVKNY